MPFIYRQINRLTNGSSGMVKLRTEVGEFDKITEVLNRRVASSFLYIPDEGRAVGRNQNQVLTADDNISFRISGMLNEFPGSSIANQALAHSFGESHPFLLHIRTCILEDFQCFRIPPEVDTDFLQNRVGIVFNETQAFLVEEIINRYVPFNVRHRLGFRLLPFGLPGGSSSAASFPFCHFLF